MFAMTPMTKAARAARSLPAISVPVAVAVMAAEMGPAHAEIRELQAQAEFHGPVRRDLVEVRGPERIAGHEGEELLTPSPHGAPMLGAGHQGLTADVIGDFLRIQVQVQILGAAQGLRDVRELHEAVVHVQAVETLVQLLAL